MQGVWEEDPVNDQYFASEWVERAKALDAAYGGCAWTATPKEPRPPWYRPLARRKWDHSEEVLTKVVNHLWQELTKP